MRYEQRVPVNDKQELHHDNDNLGFILPGAYHMSKNMDTLLERQYFPTN